MLGAQHGRSSLLSCAPAGAHDSLSHLNIPLAISGTGTGTDGDPSNRLSLSSVNIPAVLPSDCEELKLLKKNRKWRVCAATTRPRTVVLMPHGACHEQRWSPKATLPGLSKIVLSTPEGWRLITSPRFRPSPTNTFQPKGELELDPSISAAANVTAGLSPNPSLSSSSTRSKTRGETRASLSLSGAGDGDGDLDASRLWGSILAGTPSPSRDGQSVSTTPTSPTLTRRRGKTSSGGRRGDKNATSGDSVDEVGTHSCAPPLHPHYTAPSVFP